MGEKNIFQIAAEVCGLVFSTCGWTPALSPPGKALHGNHCATCSKNMVAEVEKTSAKMGASQMCRNKSQDQRKNPKENVAQKCHLKVDQHQQCWGCQQPQAQHGDRKEVGDCQPEASPARFVPDEICLFCCLRRSGLTRQG